MVQDTQTYGPNNLDIKVFQGPRDDVMLQDITPPGWIRIGSKIELDIYNDKECVAVFVNQRQYV